MVSKRLGHIGKSKFLESKSKQMIDDIKHIDKIIPNDNLYEACINGTQARLPFEKARDKRPRFIIRSDVCGPITPTIINNQNLITYKSDVSVFRDFIAEGDSI